MFPDRPMKHKRVRKEPAKTEEPTSTVQAPASLLKGKRKHANSVVEGQSRTITWSRNFVYLRV
jgi:hypothetical protein